MAKTFQSIVKEIKKNNPPFELINLNGRPVFVRPFYRNERENCSNCECSKKAIVKVFEIDKQEHYSDWDWCGNPKCILD